MIRNQSSRAFASRNLASRPVRVAVAVKIALAILAANVSFAAAKAVLAKAPEAAAPAILSVASSTKPFILPVSDETGAAPQSETTQNCRPVEVEIDEGYGVRGHVTRIVCHKAL